MTVLACHELDMPAGTAVVTTSRPTDDTPWTTTIDAPGLAIHGWTRTIHTDTAAAHITHLVAHDLVAQAIDDIPTVDMRGATP